MNAMQIDKINHASINDRELEAANDSTFDSLTQGMHDLYQGVRDLCKGTRKVMEDLDDSNSIMFSDIFGKSEVTKHQHMLENEAKREREAGNLDAANHYKRRNLNYSRNTLGEDDEYTQALKLALQPVQQEDSNSDLKMLNVNPQISDEEKFDNLVKNVWPARLILSINKYKFFWGAIRPGLSP